MNRILISILTGLGGMFGWGSADFLAGKTTGKIGSNKTFFWVQVFGLFVNILILVYSLLFQNPAITFSFSYLFLTLIASASYFVGYLLLYRSFEIGNLSIVSPISASYTIFTVLVAFFIFDQSLKSYQFLAIVLVIIGIFLLSINLSALKSRKVSLKIGVKEAFLAAILFGFFFWPMNEYITERSNWIVFNVLVKILALIMFVLFAFFKWLNLSQKDFKEKPKGNWIFLILIGFLDVAGILSVSYGISVVDSIIVMPIATAYSLVTVILARIFLKEKIEKLQALGISLVLLGIILIGIKG